MGERQRWFVHFFGSTPENAHVPMILRAPGVPPERRREPVGHVDVLPTLLELAGIEPPAGHRGIALGPFLRGGRPLPERLLLCDTGREVSAYTGEGFVRVALRDGEAPRGEAFAWGADGVWRATGSQVALPESLLDYVRSRAPTVEAPLLSPETRARLRALGYESE
jgi:arylsulfatase A-like enzyme